MPKTCPACGSQKESGKFCSQCGGTLEQGRKCTGCANTIPAGGRYCNMCGVPVAGAIPVGAAGAGAPGLNPNLPWFIAGGAMIVLAVAIVVPRFTSSEPETVATPPIAGPASQSGANPPDLSTMTPEEAAGNLYDRVMRTLSAGDTAQAMSFLPMAISAYGMVEELDDDGLYHLAVLELVNNDPTAARETAGQILERVPNHLFGLITAAQAENLMGNSEAAAALYSQFLESYDAEIAQDRPEYSDHELALPDMRAEAERLAN